MNATPDVLTCWCCREDTEWEHTRDAINRSYRSKKPPKAICGACRSGNCPNKCGRDSACHRPQATE